MLQFLAAGAMLIFPLLAISHFGFDLTLTRIFLGLLFLEPHLRLRSQSSRLILRHINSRSSLRILNFLLFTISWSPLTILSLIFDLPLISVCRFRFVELFLTS